MTGLVARDVPCIAGGVEHFEGKQRANTLPDDADARYLLGIVKNVAAKTDASCSPKTSTSTAWKLRSASSPHCAKSVKRCEPSPTSPRCCVDRALETPSNLERSFWLDAFVETLRDVHDEQERQRRFHSAAQRIEATFAATTRERHDAVRYVADRLIPVT